MNTVMGLALLALVNGCSFEMSAEGRICGSDQGCPDADAQADGGAFIIGVDTPEQPADAGSDAASDSGTDANTKPAYCSAYDNAGPGPSLVSESCQAEPDHTTPDTMKVCNTACGRPAHHVTCHNGRPTTMMHCTHMGTQHVNGTNTDVSNYCCEERACVREVNFDNYCGSQLSAAGKPNFYSCPSDEAYPGTTGTSSVAPAGCVRVSGQQGQSIGYCCAQ